MGLLIESAEFAAHRDRAAARGYTVEYSDQVGRWVLLNPFGDYRGRHATEDDAWRAAPCDPARRRRAA